MKFAKIPCSEIGSIEIVETKITDGQDEVLRYLDQELRADLKRELREELRDEIVQDVLKEIKR